MAGPGALLLDEVRTLEWPDGSVDVFVHGEAAEVRAVRRQLAEQDADVEQVSS